MISGVVTVEFRPTKLSPPVHRIRVLVRNADNLQDAIIQAVRCAVEMSPHASGNRAIPADWRPVDFDTIA